MKGMELAESYFTAFGMPMLQEQFPGLLEKLAAGLAGSGSECFGYDDLISTDHDFEPGFCLFLPDETIVDRRTAFLLERAYSKLPKEYMGFKRSLVLPVGGARKGVIRTGDFFMEKTGTPDGKLTDMQWLSIPEHSLAEAVNGRLFFDRYGEVTAVRERLAFYPETVRRKKLAGHLLLMAQAGQYNYQRCLAHHEEAAAQLAACEFVRSGMQVIFLLNRRYQPYYKWSFRALRELERLSLLAELMEYLLTTGNEAETAEEKYNVMEGIAADIIEELMEQQLTGAICQDLEKHAYSVNDGIEDPALRNMHVLAAV